MKKKTNTLALGLVLLSTSLFASKEDQSKNSEKIIMTAASAYTVSKINTPQTLPTAYNTSVKYTDEQSNFKNDAPKTYSINVAYDSIHTLNRYLDLYTQA